MSRNVANGTAQAAEGAVYHFETDADAFDQKQVRLNWLDGLERPLVR